MGKTCRRPRAPRQRLLGDLALRRLSCLVAGRATAGRQGPQRTASIWPDYKTSTTSADTTWDWAAPSAEQALVFSPLSRCLQGRPDVADSEECQRLEFIFGSARCLVLLTRTGLSTGSPDRGGRSTARTNTAAGAPRTSAAPCVLVRRLPPSIA